MGVGIRCLVMNFLWGLFIDQGESRGLFNKPGRNAQKFGTNGVVLGHCQCVGARSASFISVITVRETPCHLHLLSGQQSPVLVVAILSGRSGALPSLLKCVASLKAELV